MFLKSSTTATTVISFLCYCCFLLFSILFFSYKVLLKACLQTPINTFIINTLQCIFGYIFIITFSIVFFMHFTLFSALFSVLFSLLSASSFASLSAAVRTVEVITFQLSAQSFSCCFFLLCYRRRHVAPKAYSDNPSPHPDTGIGNIRPPL